jgi:hypothetical protein
MMKNLLISDLDLPALNPGAFRKTASDYFQAGAARFPVELY